jgi:hypothetical protein
MNQSMSAADSTYVFGIYKLYIMLCYAMVVNSKMHVM